MICCYFYTSDLVPFDYFTVQLAPWQQVSASGRLKELLDQPHSSTLPSQSYHDQMVESVPLVGVHGSAAGIMDQYRDDSDSNVGLLDEDRHAEKMQLESTQQQRRMTE